MVRVPSLVAAHGDEEDTSSLQDRGKRKKTRYIVPLCMHGALK